MADIAQIRSAQGGASDPASQAGETWDDGAGFYFALVLVSTLIIFLGFAPGFYLKPIIHAPPPLSMLTMTHGLVFTAWMALFVVQAGLIAARRPAPHRQLGILGAMLLGALIPLGLSTAITAGRLGHAPPGAPPPLAFMALPLMALAAVALLVGTALWKRRRADWHKRLMLASFFIMTGPGTGRIAIPAGLAEQGTVLSLAIADLLLLIAMGRDVRLRKGVHPAYVLATAVYAVINVGVLWAFTSPEAWMSFARSITRTA
jgi:hypothetical protein